MGSTPINILDSRSVLTAFFAQNPDYLVRMADNNCGDNKADIWDSLFEFVYGEAPEDVELDPVLTKPHKGSTDPRWKTLLRCNNGAEGYFGYDKAMREFLRELVDGTINIKILNEAA